MKKTSLFLQAALLAASLSALPAAHAAEAPAPDAQTVHEITRPLQKAGGTVFPIGRLNTGYAKYFTGTTCLAGLGGDKALGVSNVTFAPGVISRWHIHTSSCQVLTAVSGRGCYQIWGEPAREVKPGDTVTIPAGTKHWHGAARDGWYQHLSIMAPSKTEWLEPVDPAEYARLK
ncbi:cupin domain-containing protein [Mesosutterella sp. AGMB02718]|uniref:Cupin domain-containing protein n=1 Tax=Mesosutterella faecium TaxID=2925194 RepID=A0ABT7IP92_9BURK|nr:cupin domain-containing protein [Mesosutterella sp. AGMB02718]MDL2060205.1 cupin domain-containing protein [Mesosutterella sp. AGMB02718]